MNHEEIRFRILYTLYQKYYGGQLKRYQNTEEIIKESGLDNIDRNIVLGDITYLKDSCLIVGLGVSGSAHPPHIRINTSGIDRVETFANSSLNSDHTSLSDDLRQEIQQIKSENNITTKIKKVYNFVISRPELPYIEQLLRTFFGSS
jgi:hypothetical protein